MKFGISTGSIDTGGRPLTDFLEMIRDAGFECIEIDANNNTSFPFQSKEFVEGFSRKLRSLGMRVHSVHSPFKASIADPDSETRSYVIGQMLLLMRNLVPLVREQRSDIHFIIHPGHHKTRTPVHEQFPLCLDSIRELLDSHLSNHYSICIENMLSSHFGGHEPELMAILENLKGEKVSLCLDTSHAVYDSTPLDMLNKLYPYLATAHISDNYNQHHGEFHALPMSLIHSKIRWKEVFSRLAGKMEAVVLELIKPAHLDNDIFLKLARLCALQGERLLGQEE